MQKVLRLAWKGRGICSPDPMVGAVVVNSGVVVAEGYHQEQGTPHAEAVALKKAGARARGATIYVNLEPCCHWGHNPPCTLDIIASGIVRVVVAMRDPNPLVRQCNSEKILHDAGIVVEYGCLEAEALKLNEFFVKYISTRLPFVIMKSAMTLDGKTATRTGSSQWISGPKSRAHVHESRSEVDAVMVGIGTALADNPILTARDVKRRKIRQPARVVIDALAELPMDSNLIQSLPTAPLFVVVSEQADSRRVERLQAVGVTVIQCPAVQGIISPKVILQELGSHQIMSVLLEGGGTLNYHFLQEQMIDKVQIYIAPKMIGGRAALTPVGGEGLALISDAFLLEDLTSCPMDGDILLEGYFTKKR